MDSDSDDDLLNYGPSGLSQASITSSSNTAEAVIGPDELQNNNETTNMTTDLSKKDKVNARAQRFIDNLGIPATIVSAVQLGWHRYTRKTAAFLNPICIIPKDMIIGLALPQNFNESKKCAIEYLSCLNGLTGKRAVVLKSQLCPYGIDYVWNQTFLVQYLETLARSKKITELDIRKESLFLEKLLLTVKQREQNNCKDQDTVEINYDALKEPDDSGPEPSIDSSAIMMTSQDKKQQLKAGDVIEYYQTIARAGDKDCLMQALVLKVQRRKQHPLHLHNQEVLPISHSVKRIFTRIRGRFVDVRSSGSYRSIGSYKLGKSELKDSDPILSQLANEPTELENILERNLKKFESNVKSDGCGAYLEMMNLKSKKSNDDNVDKNVKKPKKRRKLGSS